MKVQGPSNPRMQPLGEQTRVKESSAKEGAAKAPSGERVEVSSTSKMLAEARGPAEPDAARISRLKEAIANGEFTINLDRIANAMVNEEL
jgi:flagellar biosynthesis anti-sigma factor FlgM